MSIHWPVLHPAKAQDAFMGITFRVLLTSPYTGTEYSKDDHIPAGFRDPLHAEVDAKGLGSGALRALV